MTGLEITLWTAGLIALFAIALFAFGLLHAARNRDLRLMRCPETESLAFVETERFARAGTTTSTVRTCNLWPERKHCARGCLKRYDETAPGGRSSVQALRPFSPGDNGGAVR